MTKYSRELIEFAINVAEEAGDIAFRLRWDSDLIVSFKEDGSKVTNADFESERHIIRAIQEKYPDHRIHGEECGAINKDSGSPYLWTIDAIDGTFAYINYENNSVVNLALLEGDRTLLGVIYNPFTHELFYTSEDQSSELNGKKLPLVKTKPLEESTLNYQISRDKADETRFLHSLWQEKKIAKIIEAGGSPAYNLACVAKGSYSHFVMYCSRAARPEDYCGPVSIVRNSGGCVTDLEGNDIVCLAHKGYFVASSDPTNHEEFLEMLRNTGFGVKKHRTKVIFAAGFYGTGKSTLARKLSDNLGYLSFSADKTRHEFGFSGYNTNDCDLIWGTLFWQAGKELDKGGNIIIESLYLNEGQRKPDYDFARGKNADGMFIEIVCSEATAKSRISKRPDSRDGTHVPTNRIEHYDLKKDQWEPVIPDLQTADRGFISYLIFDSHANKLYTAYLRAPHKEWAKEIAEALGVTLASAPESLIKAEKRYSYLSE